MRIAELSRRAQVPVPTVKYYLREGLLPPGELSSPNQARYDERHIRRLRLIRALLEVGRLPIATIKELLTDLDQPNPDLHHALGRALNATGEATGDVPGSHDVDELIARHGWQVDEHAPARRAVAGVITTMRDLGAEDLLALIDEYARAAELIAATDLELVRRRGEPEAVVHGAVIGTILGDALIAGLRRLAQESASAKLFRTTPDA